MQGCGDNVVRGHPESIAGSGVPSRAFAWIVGCAVIVGWTPVAIAQSVIYVDADASGANDGTSWADAYADVQPALAAAVAGDDVWVAEGTYMPAAPGGPRAASFALKNDVEVYGGFAGDETELDQRDPAVHITILSGDLNGDDGPDFENVADNSYHILRADNLTESAVLDGFTVSGGNASAGAPDPGGGGFFIWYSSPVIRNCKFTANRADNLGGAVRAYTLSSTNKGPTFEICQFAGNTTSGDAGAIFSGDTDTTLTGCTFTENTATSIFSFGGAIVAPGAGSLTLTGCSFNSNFAAFEGGAVQSVVPLTIVDCSFVGNSALSGGAMRTPNGSYPVKIVNCTFDSNSATQGSGGAISGSTPSNSDSWVVRCVFTNNTATGSGGAMIHFGGNIRWINCAFFGNQQSGLNQDGGAVRSGAEVYQVELTNCLFSGNEANGTNAKGGGFRGGGTLTNCTFAGNVASLGGGAFLSTGSTVTNCIAFANDAPQLAGEPAVTYSCVEGGFAGAGNIGTDPRFMDPDGVDDIAGTLDDDLRLQATSPCIDAADNAAIPADSGDLDGDGDTGEPTPLDLDGESRFVDDPATDDNGNGTAPLVDMGAYEYFPDCNSNGIIDFNDISGGTSPDCDTSGVPDECETAGTLSYAFTDPTDVVIPNEYLVLTAITAEAPGPVSDINVGIDIQHTFVPDLSVFLEHSGVSVELFTNVGSDGGGDNFTGAILDEQATNVIGSPGNDSAPFTGTYNPEGDLNAFNGLDGYGEWTLHITDVNDDDVFSGTGTLLSWTLYIETQVDNDCDGDGVPDNCQDCNTNGTNDACGIGPIPGHAVKLDGVNDNVIIPFFCVEAPTSEVTIELWQRANEAGRATFGIVPDVLSNRILARVPWSDGTVYWDFGDAEGQGRLSYTPTESILGSWQHFAFIASQSGNHMRIYRNGVLEAEKDGMDSFVQNASSLRIGAMGNDSMLAFHGLIDEFRVWTLARTQTQIQEHMFTTLEGNEPGLLAYWRMDEGEGATATDLAGQDDNGTLINGTGWSLIEEDCNTNGVPDACDADCNSNAVPDECELADGGPDCDTNGALDACDLATNNASDCNSNSVPDVCEVTTCIAVTSVDPVMHEVNGGSPVVILGEELSDGLLVQVNGLPLEEMIYVDSGKWLGRVPSNPAGTFDLVVSDPDTGEVLAVHPGAVQYEQRRLPAPEDVSGTLRMDGSVQLKWSNLINHDSITIKRAGEVIATLAGDAQEFVDPSPGDGNYKEYEIIGTRGESDSHGAVATVPLIIDFDPCFSPYNFANSHQVLRPAGTKRLTLYGSEFNERQGWFHMAAGDSGNLEITLRAARLHTGGQLLARIRELQPPHDIVRDNIAMGDRIISAEAGLLTGESTGAQLPEGDYILGFYVEGGDATQVIFSLVTDASETDVGDPYPCPPFPLATIRALCGFGPNISSISVQLPTTETNGHWRYPEFESAFNTENPYAPPEFQPRTRVLVADANDLDGKVVNYEWDFGTGKPAKSKSNSVTHAFPEFGFYNVQLRVTDDSGRTDAASTTVALKPIGIPPAAGSPPAITHLSPPPAKGSFMPAIDPDVLNTYIVLVTPAAGDRILGVSMEMVDSAGNVYQSQEAVKALEGDADPATFWKATFNMSDLPDEFAVTLRIEADQEFGPDDALEQTIELCKLPPYYALPFVETDVSYDTFAKEYSVVGTLGVFHDDPITLFDGYPFELTVNNAVELGLTGRQRLRNKRWESSSLQGDARVELLDFDVFNESFEAKLPENVELTTCGTYEFCYMADELQLFSTSQEFPLIEDATLYTAPGVTIEGSLAIGFEVDVDADVSACVRYPEDPYAALDIQVDTDSSAWVSGELDADILYGLASATFQIKPTINLSLPVTVGLELAPPGLNVTAEPCFMFDVDVQVETCGAWGLVCEEFGPYEIYHEDFNCDGPPQPEEDPNIPPLQMPALATSTDGQIGLVVHVKNIAPPGAIDHELYFSVDTGSGLSIPAPLYSPSDEYNQMDPAVAFLSETQALAVWNQGRLTLEELATLTTGPEDLNHLAKHSDIFFARWTLADGWEPPQALVDDTTPLIPDGKPAVAAIPDQSAAWVAWVRSDNEDMFDSVGAPILSGMSIYARKIDAAGPSGDPIKVSSGDESEPAADIEPAIAWSPMGNTGCIVFVRDADSDFNTSEDRVLLVSFFSSGTWALPVQLTDPIELPGVLMPGIALSSDDDGMLTFTVRNRLADGSVAGEGNQDLIYTMELRDGAFQPPVQLRRQTCSSGRSVFGRNPIVRYLDDVNAVVTFRDFDGFGVSGGDGELAISTIDLAQPTPKWTLVRNLTNDNVRDWEIDMATGPGEMIHTVRINGAEELGGICMANVAWVPDLEVDDVLLSDPHTQPGLPVRITAVLRNAGLRSTTDMPMPEPMLHIGIVENEVFTEIAAVPFSFEGIQADDEIKISHSILAPSETTHLRVIADPTNGELDMNNNTNDVMLGVLPPTNVTCVGGPLEGESRSVMLAWTNGEAYDAVLIYRDDRLNAKLPGSAESYTDPNVEMGAHVWTVRGAIGLALSDPTLATCEIYVNLCTGGAGDLTADGLVRGDDVQCFIDCLLLAGEAVCGPCDCADMNGNGIVDDMDVGAFVMALLAS